VTQPGGEPLVSPASQLFKRHPWHGVPIGPEAPDLVTCYIEIVPTDTVKYELDKMTGHLKIDRPQKYSSVCPTLYGLLPQTYCGDRVADACRQRVGRQDIVGDGDPMDVCVLSERPISHGDVLLRAIPIGGLRMIDHNQADDKIIAVLKDDPAYGDWTDIYQCPPSLIDRLRHYFLTYKEVPGDSSSGGLVEIAEVYGRRAAHDMILRSREDYRQKFGHIERLAAASDELSALSDQPSGRRSTDSQVTADGSV
jgi:inorganic pyrophosphatase